MYFESISVISTNVRLFSVVKIGRHFCRLCCYICLYFVGVSVCLSLAVVYLCMGLVNFLFAYQLFIIISVDLSVT